MCGKWGLGDEHPGGYAGLPTHQGFDFFYGYLNQRHAHNYYPEFLWHNRERVPLRNIVVRAENSSEGFNAGHASKRVDYSHDLIVEQALHWIEQNREHPFFLYVPFTIPHANNEGRRMTGNGQEVPDFGPYADEDWPDQDKGQAAMITRMDGDVGRLLDLLAELGLDEKTVVIFTSDNGPHREGGQDTDRFIPAGPLRGFKRDLYEGGIRVPFIARWPQTTPAGVVSDHIGYFGDLMATAAELGGVKPPEDVDSISFVPTLKGHADEQAAHDYLYWEFYEQGGKQAVRFGDWKAIRMPIADRHDRTLRFEVGPGRIERRRLAPTGPRQTGGRHDGRRSCREPELDPPRPARLASTARRRPTAVLRVPVDVGQARS